MKVELSPEAKILIDRYFNIKVGEWSFACPYFMNERGLRNLPIAYSGKGLPEEIEAEISKIYERKKGVVKSAASAKKMMIFCILGIDCSGLVVNILDEHLKETRGLSIYDVVRYPSWVWRLRAYFRPRTNISADLLTGELNIVAEELAQVRPGDMIKRGRNHVMLVEWVDARQFGYIHADTMPEWGLQRGAVEVIDAKLPLEKQGWSVKEDLGLYKKAGDKGLVRLRVLM